MKILDKFNDVVFGEGIHVIVHHNNSESEDYLDKIKDQIYLQNLDKLVFFDHINGNFHIRKNFGHGLYWQNIKKAMENDWPKDQQMFISTQNPFVFDCLSFESEEDVRSKLLIINKGQLQNLSKDNANMFWQAYNAGIQHVSEILRTQGIW